MPLYFLTFPIDFPNTVKNWKRPSYQCLSAFPILLLFSSGVPVMLIQVLTKSMQDQAHIFKCTCCRSFQIHLLVKMYHDPHLILYSQIIVDSFCMFVISICDIFHCKITVILFPAWQRRFYESLATIHLLIRINTFPQLQTKFVNVSITESVCVLKCFVKIFVKHFLIIFVAVYTLKC